MESLNLSPRIKLALISFIAAKLFGILGLITVLGCMAAKDMKGLAIGTIATATFFLMITIGLATWEFLASGNQPEG